MTRPALSSTTAAAGVALLLLLTGCGGDDAGTTSGGGEKPAVGPLEEYFSAITEDMGNQDFEAMSAEVEEITATCMREEGFDYTPQDTSSYGEVVEEPEDGPAYDSIEYARENGYGMTAPAEESVDEAPAEEFVDANADYVAAMSESEQQAYYEALYGVQPEVDESDPDAEYEYDWQTAGCSGRASHEVYEEGQPFSDPDFAALQEEMSDLYEQMASDPAVAELNSAWAACMADAGYEGMSTVDEASMALSEELNALYEDSGETGVPDEEAMAELHEKEIDTAVADRTCQDEVGYTKGVQEVQFSLEQDFIDAHRAELDAMLEAYSQAGE